MFKETKLTDSSERQGTHLLVPEVIEEGRCLPHSSSINKVMLLKPRRAARHLMENAAGLQQGRIN